MRAFLAIEISGKVSGEILRIREILENGGLFKGRFVEPQNMHLTLKFFGDILDKEAGMIHDVLEGISFPKFNCKLGGLGFFGDRILWIDLNDDGSIKRLHDLIDEKLGDFFGIDERFHNHVTIARIKSIKDRERLREAIKRINVNNIEFSVDEYKLKKSELTSGGPIYEDIYSFRLD